MKAFRSLLNIGSFMVTILNSIKERKRRIKNLKTMAKLEKIIKSNKKLNNKVSKNNEKKK